MKFIDDDIELTIEEKEAANKLNIEKKRKKIFDIINDPKSKSVDDLFYKVSRDLRKISEERANDSKVFDFTISQLVQYDEYYYDQLLTNLGMDYKLKIFITYQKLGLNQDILTRIEARTFGKLKTIVSKPIMDVYFQREDYGFLNDIEVNSLISKILTALEEGILGLADCISHLIRSDNDDTEYDHFYANYLIALEYLIETILNALFDKDIPMSKSDLISYYYIEKFLWCFLSPATDPLIAFYKELI